MLLVRRQRVARAKLLGYAQTSEIFKTSQV
jgi:hypothetical protein